MKEVKGRILKLHLQRPTLERKIGQDTRKTHTDRMEQHFLPD